MEKLQQTYNLKQTIKEETDTVDADYLKSLEDASRASQKDEKQESWIEGYRKWKKDV